MASVVVEEIAHRILGGALREGDVLPTEPALCEEFGFSRSRDPRGPEVARGARARPGRAGSRDNGSGRATRGTCSIPTVLRIALVYDHDMVLLDDLIAVRRLLEREMARAAATRLSEDELAALADNVQRMTSSIGDYDAVPLARSRLSRRDHESLGQRDRSDDRPHDPHERRTRLPAQRTGRARVARVHDRGASGHSTRRWSPATVSSPRAASRRTSTPPGLSAATTSSASGARLRRVRLGPAVAARAHRRLTSAHHSYDDSRRCESQLSMSS